MRNAILAILAAAAACAGQSAGPARGALVVAGGGKLGPEIVNRFLELVGGVDAPIVVIPTAQEDSGIAPGWLEKSVLAQAGARRLSGLHTRDRAAADTTAFAAPLR
jgi:cyanophycinase